MLDLVDADEIPAGNATSEIHPEPNNTEVDEVIQESGEDEIPVGRDQPVETAQEPSQDEPLETISNTARLFVRNLPYTATEDDIRSHFEQYGSLQEVRYILTTIMMFFSSLL